MSSASPPKEPDVEPETQSGDDPEQMDRDNQDPSGQGQGEFEVKEQDRWLPIANGPFNYLLSLVTFHSLSCSCVWRCTFLPYCAVSSSPPLLRALSLLAPACAAAGRFPIVCFRPFPFSLGLLVNELSTMYLVYHLFST